MADLNVVPMGDVGAEIRGVDIATIRDEGCAAIRAALGEHGVLFFRDQELSPEQHIAFAERIGVININRFFTPVEGYPMIAEVRKEPDQQINIGGSWHTDHSYDEAPALGSILYALDLPEQGGDTLFASMVAAYAALSPGLKDTLEQLSAVHSSRHVFGAGAEASRVMSGRLHNADNATQDVVHPIVIRHPDSGKKVLYVNPGFTVGIDGWRREESKPLLEFLYQHAMRPEFQIRFRWEPGSIAFWDNRATWHYALNDYPGERRLMHRITIEGVPLSA